MRYRPIWVVLLVLAIASTVSLLRVSVADSQTSGESGPTEVAKPFDAAASLEFQKGLNSAQRTRLIRLNSRFALADAACPLPMAEPSMPFHVKFIGPMGRAFAGKLMEAGATFVGYAPDHTHCIRARDAESLQAIGALLGENPNVAGTLPLKAIDRMQAQVWLKMQDETWTVGEFRIQYWADVSAQRAEALIDSSGAEIISADRHADGTLDMATRHVELRLTREALNRFIDSTLVEMIELYFPYQEENLDSKILHNATENEIGAGTPYNLTGEGIITGIWDSGRARDTHETFQGAYTGGTPWDLGTRRVISGWEMMNNPIFSFIDGNVDTANHSSHATHVAGTIIGDGTSGNGLQGVGYAPKAYIVSLNWGSIDAERRLMRHYFRHVADNHSYGDGSSNNGGYTSVAVTSDTDIRDLFIKMTKSSGNEGSGSNTIQSGKGMKNSFTIGAAQDNGVITSFSSRGPANDGRLNIHFMFNGNGLYSSDNGSNTHYSSKSGTSMAAPSASGSLVLLSELYMREHNKRELPPDVGRAVLAATTTDVYNTGPDYRYGFGLGNIKRAADLILADVASSGANLVRDAVRQDQVIEYTLEVTDSNEPLRVVLSWLDVYGSTNAAVVLVNDLDLELIDPAGRANSPIVHYPYSGLESNTQGDQTYQWTNTAPNRRDNLEWIEVPNPTTGTWIVRVTGHSIPSNPQTGVPNDVVGFVLASERPMAVAKEIVEDAVNTSAPIAIPDNDPQGIVRTFEMTDSRAVRGVRLYVDIQHRRRGDLSIRLTAPHGRSIDLETTSGSTRRDLIGVLPDTRQYADDVMKDFFYRGGAGTWTVQIADNDDQNTGELRYLALELDYLDGNAPPVADAGGDRTIAGEIFVRLKGNGSTDFDGDPLTVLWEEIGTSLLNFDDPTSLTPGFTSPTVAAPTPITVRLTVSDGTHTSIDEAVLTILEPGVNGPPVAHAGQDEYVAFGTTVTLNSAGTFDPDGDPLTFLWQLTSGKSTITLSNPTGTTTSFTAPNTGDTLVFRLVVEDNVGHEVEDSVTIYVNRTGTKPVKLEGSSGGSGGCASGGGATWGMGLLIALAIVARRRRKRAMS